MAKTALETDGADRGCRPVPARPRGPASGPMVWRATAPTRSRFAHEHRQGGPAGRPVDVPGSAALAPVHTNSGHTAGWADAALRARPPTAAAMATGCTMSTRRAVDGVGQCPAPERAGNQGDELDDADEADDEGRMGEPEGLIGDGHDRELRAHARHDLAGPQSAKVPVPPKRRDVEDEAGHRRATVTGSAFGVTPADVAACFSRNKAVIDRRTGKIGGRRHFIRWKSP